MTLLALEHMDDCPPVLYEGRPWFEHVPDTPSTVGTLVHRSDGVSGCGRCGWSGIASSFGGRRGRRRDHLPGMRGYALTDSRRSNVCPSCRTASEREHDTADPTQLTTDHTVRRLGPKVSRNQPCPCGSGRKAKRCCHG